MGELFSSDWLESHRVDLAGMSDDQVVGIGHVMTELGSVLGRLNDPARAAALGARLPRGMIFSGPPGTGKTLCARWLAAKLSARAEADGEGAVPFYELSSDELSPERIRGLMRYLAESHPRSVVYLDEIDSWAVYRDYESHSPETRLVLTATLAALDGLVPTAGPVIIASSTRHVREIDSALRRAGRLGFHVAFDVPDEIERSALFELFARGRPLEEPLDWEHAARLTRGRTPAEIAQLVDDAAGYTLAQGRMAVAMGDILWAIRRGGEVTPEVMTDPAVAYRARIHESGHLAVAVALEGSAFVYSIRLNAVGGETAVGGESVDAVALPDSQLRSHLAVGFGGLAAEAEIFGDATMGAENDLASVTTGLLRRVSAGLDHRFPPVVPEAFGHLLPGRLKSRLAHAAIGTAEELRELATAAVVANREAIVRFAAILETSPELSGAALQAAIENAGFARLNRAGRRRRTGASATSRL